MYLAMAPKSNAVYAAYNAARADIKNDRTRPVPLRLRNAPTALMKGLDYGKGYRYAHDEEGAFAAGERYWPDDMKRRRFYRPVARGLEISIGERLAELRRLNQQARERGDEAPGVLARRRASIADLEPGRRARDDLVRNEEVAAGAPTRPAHSPRSR